MNDELKQLIDNLAFDYRGAVSGVGKNVVKSKFKMMYAFAYACDDVKTETIKYLESRAKDFAINIKDLV